MQKEPQVCLCSSLAFFFFFHNFSFFQQEKKKKLSRWILNLPDELRFRKKRKQNCLPHVNTCGSQSRCAHKGMWVLNVHVLTFVLIFLFKNHKNCLNLHFLGGAGGSRTNVNHIKKPVLIWLIDEKNTKKRILKKLNRWCAHRLQTCKHHHSPVDEVGCGSKSCPLGLPEVSQTNPLPHLFGCLPQMVGLGGSRVALILPCLCLELRHGSLRTAGALQERQRNINSGFSPSGATVFCLDCRCI